MEKSSFIRGAILLMCTTALSASAAGDNMLVHINGSTAPVQVEISGQTKITFDNAVMKISQTSGDTTLDIADIDRMVFDLHTSSVDNIEASLDQDITFVVDGKHISATSASGSEITLHIYDTAGHNVATTVAPGNVEFDFSDRKAGVYIIICGDKTLKYLNR